MIACTEADTHALPPVDQFFLATAAGEKKERMDAFFNFLGVGSTSLEDPFCPGFFFGGPWGALLVLWLDENFGVVGWTLDKSRSLAISKPSGPVRYREAHFVVTV